MQQMNMFTVIVCANLTSLATNFKVEIKQLDRQINAEA